MPETVSHVPTGKFGMWVWIGDSKEEPPSPKIQTGEPEFNPNTCRHDGIGCGYKGAYEFGFASGGIDIRADDMKDWGKSGAEFICRNCAVSPEVKQAIKDKKDLTSWNNLRRLRVINDKAEYVPFDSKWVDQFPELKRITPYAKNYYDTTATRSEKQFQEELSKIKSAEPLQILNEVQHIKPEIIETPIQEKSFIDKNKNYLIIGGIAITALILILVVRK